MNQFFYSSGRFGWGWVKVDTVGSLGAITFDVPYPNPDHPFLAGLVEPINIILTEDLSVGRPLVSNALDSGTTLVGTTTTFNRTKMPLFTIDAGTILADPSSSAAGNIRIGWPLAGNFNNPDGWSVINANGEQIMRNIIATVLPVEPEPLRITNISLDPETGDFLVMFSPAGSDQSSNRPVISSNLLKRSLLPFSRTVIQSSGSPPMISTQ